ncbi:hypothetical protein [Actinomadura macra]|uniref:hypothetical protein n=1 Tax=Actinomadura macra TaxID=46164 RepID=UPI001C3F1B4C
MAIARAVAGDPALLLADEPTGNLDSVSGAGVMELLRELNEAGTTILVITHDREIADDLPRQVPMRDGQLTVSPGNTAFGKRATLPDESVAMIERIGPVRSARPAWHPPKPWRQPDELLQSASPGRCRSSGVAPRCAGASRDVQPAALSLRRSTPRCSSALFRSLLGGQTLLAGRPRRQSTAADAVSSLPMVSRYWPFRSSSGPFQLLGRNQLTALPNQRERWSSRSC